MTRIQWIDYARGIAIFGVVLWHVVGGVVNSGVPTTESMARFGDMWDLYTFRLMPIFFFLSGAFFLRSLSHPFQEVLVNKARTIVYPYFFWSIVMLVIGTLTINVRNGSETIAEFPRLFYDPILHFWFLFALFVIMMVIWLAYKVGMSRWSICVIALILFVLSAATAFYHYWYVVGQIGYFAAYFVAGLFVGPTFLERVATTPIRIHNAMFVTGILLLIAIPIEDRNYTALVWQPLAATIVMMMTINLSALLAHMRVPALVIIRQWGQLSLEIYLIHVLALSTIRIVMQNVLGIENAWLNISAGIIAGLYVPIAIKWVTNKIRMDVLFVAPRLQLRPVNPKVIAE